MLNRISVIGLLAAASLVFFTAGCRTNPQWDADNDRNDRNGRYVAGAEDDPGAGTAIAGPTEVPQPAGGSSWTDNPNELSNAGADADGWTPADPSGKRLNMPVIYFAYDSDVLVASEMRKVQGIAQYMAQNPQLALVLEGHCDQRGTEEYNRALGERRANAVRAALVLSKA